MGHAVSSERKPAGRQPAGQARQVEFVQTGGVRPLREQRSEARVVSVFRLAKLIGASEELCLIRNISSHGLKLEVFSPKTVGEDLAVDFGDGVARPAKVRWVSDDCIGLAFDDEIDVAETLARVAAPGDRRARRLRLMLEVGAGLGFRRALSDCQLIDVSQGGAKIRTATVLAPGDHVSLEVEGLGTLAGSVRWVRDSHVGIAFATALSYRQLAGWIASASVPATAVAPPRLTR
jgi:hypothetical protein